MPLLLAVAAAAPARATTAVPTGFEATVLGSGIADPVAMTVAPDGRIFVTEKGGWTTSGAPLASQVRVIENGALLPTPFLTLTNAFGGGERGLLGITLDPAFEANHYVYVVYTAAVEDGTYRNRVSRFVADGDVAQTVDGVVTEDVLYDFPDTADNEHQAGGLRFGADGDLYVTTGDNGEPDNSQSLSSIDGKVLRLNADGSIPTDNPFVGNGPTGAYQAIWALGLRNPFTFAFQPGTARMFINDVGEATWEEIDDGIAGSNYGWPQAEGPTTDPGLRGPLYSYGHVPSDTNPVFGCAITGGTFYDPATTQFPSDYVGDYFFSDFCGHWIKAYDPVTGSVTDFATTEPNPIDLEVGADGSLYYLTWGGTVVQISHVQEKSAPAAPTDVQAAPDVGQETLSWRPPTDDGGSPVTGYQVSRDGTDAAGTGPSSTTVSASTTSLTFTHLNAWTPYTLSVQAINAYGTGTATSVTISLTAPTPGPPTGVTATTRNHGALLQWAPPVQTGTSAITGYRIRRFAGNTTAVQATTTVAATARSFTTSGLTNGSTYSFDVTAINGRGMGANSTRSNAVVPAVPVPPDALSGLVASTNGAAKTATISWSPPAFDGGAPITGYRVSRDGVDTGGTGPSSTTVSASTRSFTFWHLNAWETYTLSVQAVNVAGPGVAATQPVMFTAVTPGPATGVTASRGNHTATVQWTAPTQTGTSAITGYRIRRFTGTSTTVQSTVTVAATARSFTASGLTNGSTYSFDVTPINSSGVGANSFRSNAVVPATLPNAPVIGTALAGVAGGAITATAHWSAPSNGGSAITGYKVTALRMNSTGTVLTTTVSSVLAATSRSYAMTLPVAGNYRFTVQAINAVGSSGQSARSNQVAAR